MYRNSLILLILTFSSFNLIDCTRVIADDRFLKECEDAHNRYRSLHENTGLVNVSRAATEYAVNRVMALAKMDGHRIPNDKRMVYGENFYWYYDTKGYHTCKDAVDVWYNGISKYSYNRPGFTDSSGGFSQVVWRDTKSIGCALIEYDKNVNYPETFIVCNYYPAGNIDNQYPYNVYPIKKPSKPTPSNEWSVDRPPSAHRPGNRPDDRPINSGGNRPQGSGGYPVEMPGGGTGSESGTWPIPSRPTSPNYRPKPPSAPSYPLIFLHPFI